MSEIRKVIGVLDQLVTNKNGIAFPSVRVWIRGANDYETHGLEQSFPERGTVYLHVSACENQHPQRNQVGLFNCVESPGQRAAWKVSSTLRHLAKVVDCPVWERRPEQLAVWEWLAGYKDTISCSILLSQGIVYVRRGKRELVGPFGTSSDGKLVPREQTFLFEGVEIVGIDISGRPCGFIDTELLPKGKPLVLDPREAIHRRLKLLNKTGHVEWLSRAKAQELSTALAGVNIADGSEWVMENLPRALEVIDSSGDIDPRVAEAVLQIKALDHALEAVWKKKHAETVKQAERETEGLKNKAGDITKSIEVLNVELQRLQSERLPLEGIVAELNKQIDASKADAQKVFEAELKRLAQSPVSLALLAAWSGGGNKAPYRSAPVITVQHRCEQQPQATNLATAVTNNLKACGLSPISAVEVAAVCGATLAAGQPIMFKSLCADLLADALTTALGQPGTVWADVPAGLLDPVDWDSIIPADQKGNPIVLQAVNRSDAQLVLGSLRPLFLRQALGYQKPDQAFILTMETNAEMQVQSDFLFGSLIDDRILRFNSTNVSAVVSSFTNFARSFSDVAPVSEDEFAEMGEDMRGLAMFASSAQRLVFRRSYGALRKLLDKPADVARLFFKYWCLPRLSSEDARIILNARKEAWEQDKMLSELVQSLTANE